MMRGQVVIEFMILICIAVLLGVVYLGIGNELLHDTSEQQRVEALNALGYTIQDEIILATTVEDGYRRTLTLPDKADRFVYNITNDETTVTLSSGEVTIVYDIPRIDGTFVQGGNLISKNGGIMVN